MKYFAYGSNMLLARLKERVPSARFYKSAVLSAHKLAFHKAGKDGSAKCDAFYTESESDELPGVIFEIDEAEKPNLDKAEGLGYGYEIKKVSLKTQDGELIEAFTYYATDINDSLLPFDWYKEFVLKGASENNLPKAHIKMIEDQHFIKDKDRHRAAFNYQILAP